ncbi:unnamed protein product [marine sediment metagenome]|uniref:ribose-phosphate diphosphokinase n=1 Tax=marine sediment metagenome TaxID=412755 RepID=X1BMX3_9ZZZZ
MSQIKLFTGNAHPQLAHSISEHLNLPLGNANVGRFSDGEIMVEINENVRGRDVFIIQPTCAPGNDNLMELVIMADALHRASATRITAVIPYYGYARQDRRIRSARVPITAKVIADMMTAVGIDRVLTVDLHADQIQGFFSIPVDNVYGTPEIIKYIRQLNYNLDNLLAVSTMSSTIIQSQPLGSPIICMTSALLGPMRRLSMMAKFASLSRLAVARARITPPTSGDTTNKLSKL